MKRVCFILVIVLFWGGLNFWKGFEKKTISEKSSSPAFSLIFTNEQTGAELNALTKSQIEANSWRVSLRIEGQPDIYFASIMTPIPLLGIDKCMIAFKIYDSDGEGYLSRPVAIWNFSPVKFKDGSFFAYEQGKLALHRRS